MPGPARTAAQAAGLLYQRVPLKSPPVSMTKEGEPSADLPREAAQWSGRCLPAAAPAAAATPLLIFMETNSITLGSDIVLNSDTEPLFSPPSSRCHINYLNLMWIFSEGSLQGLSRSQKVWDLHSFG